jgi:DNA-binding transcriptional LysR family regulator
MVLVVDDKHSLAGKKVVGPAEISQIDLILYDQTTNMRRRLDAFFREKNISPRVLFESSSVEIMKRMVEAGLCSAIIPSSNLLEGPEKNLRALRIRGKPLTREVGIAAPDVWRIPKVLDTLLALLRKQFDEVKPLIQDAFSQSRLNAGINVGEAGRRSKTPPVRP